MGGPEIGGLGREDGGRGMIALERRGVRVAGRLDSGEVCNAFQQLALEMAGGFARVAGLIQFEFRQHHIPGWNPRSMVSALRSPRSDTKAAVTVTQQSAICAASRMSRRAHRRRRKTGFRRP